VRAALGGRFCPVLSVPTVASRKKFPGKKDCVCGNKCALRAVGYHDRSEVNERGAAAEVLDLDANERKLFEQTTLPHLDAAYNLARWLTQDTDAAQDVVQEAYFRAARYYASFRGGDAKPWLLGIVRRASLDWTTKQRGRATVSFDEDMHDRGDDASNPAFLAVRHSDQESVRKALDDLPPHLREAIVLRELEGLSYQQIAAIAEVPIGTVMSRISRGRRQLQERLAAVSES
jgi:RNA polymerase sigma-70 factor (ECF subfamily)